MTQTKTAARHVLPIAAVQSRLLVAIAAGGQLLVSYSCHKAQVWPWLLTMTGFAEGKGHAIADRLRIAAEVHISLCGCCAHPNLQVLSNHLWPGSQEPGRRSNP